MAYMAAEMEEVSFVRIVLMACGKKERVVQIAATMPTPAFQSIVFTKRYQVSNQ